MDDRFEQLLKRKIGLDVESVGQVVLERAIRQRIKATASGDEDSYWQQLHVSPAEQLALVEAVVVPETWFFRYPESFSQLVKLAQARLTELKHARPLRIISLPCSTGEEPYSIVMALLDDGLAPQSFEVDALDVSERVIQLASEGVYGRNSFRGDSLGFRDRHFSVEGDRYLLDQSVREKVNLQCSNLFATNLHSTRQPYDFVFCRNLLIYFDRPTQLQALQTLKRLLAPGGAMFTGPAETGLFSQNGMQALAAPLSFVFKVADVSPPVSKPSAGLSFQTQSQAARPLQPVAKPVMAKPRQANVSKPALAELHSSAEGSAVTKADTAAAELSAIEALANSGRTAEALKACHLLLDTHGASAGLFYWLGLLSDTVGDSDAAQNFYRKALYLEPEHIEALSHLAMLLEARGDQAGARRLRQRASRGVNNSG
ncbi:CheR family methyltransferase [Pseudomonas sp. M30-35]|uniref:CheR family methyltransferase n=1 Tax=Pseudomonas sp. M30-35 TaxID=1981174 RepID=UPI000B3C1760|nr:CheR family methyltransferase [Pseudomonas sp. M30-35]ARU87729.1 chemotaxis protein CheR [Pseudomonas sp. M30-35]